MSKNNLSLIESKPVAVFVFVTLLIAGALFATIAINSDFAWDLSYNGFNFFVSAFSVPLAIVSSIIPMVGLVALYHRSYQTKVQIDKAEAQLTLANKQFELTQENNKFTNYYKHVEEFEKFVAGKMALESKELYQTFNARQVYKNIHLDSRVGIYEPLDLSDIEAIQALSSILDTLINFLENGGLQETNNTNEQRNDVIKLQSLIRSMFILQMRVFARVGYGKKSTADISHLPESDFSNGYNQLVQATHSLLKTLIHYNEIIFFSSSHNFESPYMELHRHFLYFTSDAAHHVRGINFQEEFIVDILKIKELSGKVFLD